MRRRRELTDQQRDAKEEGSQSLGRWPWVLPTSRWGPAWGHGPPR